MGIQARNPNEDDEEREDETSGEPVGEIEITAVDGPVLSEIDHVAIVVEDLDDAIASHRDTFGVLVVHREELHDDEVEVAFLEVGGSTIQLISPTGDESPFAEFLAEGGPGLHHVGYRVPDLAAALEALDGAGGEVIDDEPQDGPRESKVAYVHPDPAFGVLVQLVER